MIRISKKAHRKKLSKKSTLKDGLSQSQAKQRDSQIQKNLVAYRTHRNARSASVSSCSSAFSNIKGGPSLVEQADSAKEDEDNDNDDNSYPPQAPFPHTPPSQSENDEDIPAVKKCRRMSQDQRLALEFRDRMASGSGHSNATD